MPLSRRSRTLIAIAFFASLCVAVLVLASRHPMLWASQPYPRWTKEQANKWYDNQQWLVGSNYVPASASNQLEMWQAETFDPVRIDTELGWAEELGMNTMRVFLHDLLWEQDPEGFKKRINQFLEISAKHHIRPIFVLFDSCWDPSPHTGPQDPPIPGIHNSRWVQSPSAKTLEDPTQYPRLEAYVKGVVGAFAKDERILAWDVWNEPDNTRGPPVYRKQEFPDKVARVTGLLPRVFAWARSVHPVQPLTSAVWQGSWLNPLALEPVAEEQLMLSDIITFHNYENPGSFDNSMQELLSYGRPIICTEYMARQIGSTFQSILPVARKYKAGVINWGFVEGKTQTTLPWDSWRRPYVNRQPAMWFHDVLQSDGTPYRQEEVDFIKRQISLGLPLN